MPLPSTPTPELVSKYLQQWEQLENYRLQEQSLGLRFKQFCPTNDVLEHVLLKVSQIVITGLALPGANRMTAAGLKIFFFD